MENKITIPLEKRNVKFLLHVGITFAVTLIGFNLSIATFETPTWWMIMLSVIFVGFSLFLLWDVYTYLFYKDVKVNVLIKGSEIHFFCTNSNNKEFNKWNYNLKKIKKAYILEKTRKVFIKDYFIEFKTAKETETINLLPDLYSIHQDDLRKILLFMKENSPELELGYQ
ncbi:MAG: hypothetical protein MUC49_12435 [Raineya sp.]|jgi:hypothetical protein|nr:hypothetical protein [Raineya sp.]